MSRAIRDRGELKRERRKMAAREALQRGWAIDWRQRVDRSAMWGWAEWERNWPCFQREPSVAPEKVFATIDPLEVRDLYLRRDCEKDYFAPIGLCFRIFAIGRHCRDQTTR